jgi:hypothetical protein
MKKKFAIGLVAGLWVLGSVQAATSQPTFESAKRRALELHGSLISQAAPQVRAKISASASAFRKHLAECGRDCDFNRFLSRDLKVRFKRVSEREFHLLMALVFAEAVSDMNQLDQLNLQDKLQKEQAFIQTISNIMKNQNDTLKAIISNLRG